MSFYIIILLFLNCRWRISPRSEREIRRQMATPTQPGKSKQNIFMAIIFFELLSNSIHLSILFSTFKGEISLDDFYRTRTLASGNFGRVILVQHKWNKQFYAMKVLEKQKVNYLLLRIKKDSNLSSNLFGWTPTRWSRRNRWNTHWMRRRCWLPSVSHLLWDWNSTLK